jgi:prophage regulatory protein
MPAKAVTNKRTAARQHLAAIARQAKQQKVPKYFPPKRSVGTQLMSKAEVLSAVGVTYPTIWQWMNEGRFPRSVSIGARCAWRTCEIEAWIAALPLRELKCDRRAV